MPPNRDNLTPRRRDAEITGGTGVFEDITGEGTITGAFTCLPAREATCAQLGVLADAVFSLQGTYSDPTT